ncbi:hypothetical protein KM043_013517 [Ampulex compressa]|nr:hypothetical protein KM043_013517 [Ampulex compressa]
MALIAWILLACTAIVPSGSEQLADERHAATHRMVWPLWYHERIARARHEHDARLIPREATTRSPWSREDLAGRTSSTTTRSPQSKGVRHHVEHRFVEQRPTTARSEKYSAVAVAEYSGTRAVAYAGYHNNHRHQSREAVTQAYQRAATTAPTYTRHHPGRRVCARQAVTPTTHHHRGRQIRLVYTELSTGFMCCPGWTQVTHLSFGCNKPSCAAPCLNGGICSAPGKCTCPKGFVGNQCQTDVDECVTEKPCGQLCRNLPGSYECHCRPGFHLQDDGLSCRNNNSDDAAFEARDLENDFYEPSTTTTRRPSTSSHGAENEVGDADLDQEYEIILKRLTKLEKQVARGRKRDIESNDMSARITLAVESINEMKRTVENVQLMQQEIYDMRNKIKEYELETRKVQHLTSRVAELENRLRIRCRSAIPMNTGLTF